MFTVNPHEIKVKEDLPRFRKEMGNVTELLESIRKFGQLQPVVVSRNMDLIVGGRRLAACLLGNIPVNCEYLDILDPVAFRELELEENIQRKNFTPAEEIEAIAEIHKLKQLRGGVSLSGREGGHTQQDTADLLGISRASVVENIVLAEVLKSFPELRECKTKSDIKRAAKGMIRVAESVEAMEKYEDILRTKKDVLPQVTHADALEMMPLVPDGSVDLLLTDPPYGQDITETKMGLGGATGGPSLQSVIFNDDKETSLILYSVLATESFRFCSHTAHAYVFTCPEHFHIVRTYFKNAGWDCYIKPMIWYKRGAGQTNQPSRWPSSSYEMILFCRKDKAKLVLEGQQDVLDIPITYWGDKIHPTEKPVDLGRELIRRTSLPGSTLYDPFSGSGAFLEAGFHEKLISYGVEKDPQIYALAIQRIAERCQK